jgi:hypothetical protein
MHSVTDEAAGADVKCKFGCQCTQCYLINSKRPLSDEPILIPPVSVSTNHFGTSGKYNDATSNKVPKRESAITWDEYFMSVAYLSAMRSKDPNTQVGACIVSPDKRIVGIGYNGFPRGCNDDDLPWARVADDPLDTKYPVCYSLSSNIIILVKII